AKDIDLLGESSASFQPDEVKPLLAEGEMICSFVPATLGTAEENAKRIRYTTEIEVELTYSSERLTKAFMDAIPAEQIVSTADGKTVLKSTVNSWVEFVNDSKQQSIASSRTVVGYYVGSVAQSFNNFTVGCEYLYEKGSASCKITYTDNVVSSKSFTETSKLTLAENFVDNEQMYLYARSFDQTSTGFTKAVIEQVMDPLGSKNLIPLTISRTASVKAYLYNGEKYLIAPINQIQIATGTVSKVMYCHDSETFEVANVGSVNSNATVKIQDGYLSYSLQLSALPMKKLKAVNDLLSVFGEDKLYSETNLALAKTELTDGKKAINSATSEASMQEKLATAKQKINALKIA
ncbi:MAG: hypothetical protein RR291_05270, partial [Clostridia bacterium]